MALQTTEQVQAAKDAVEEADDMADQATAKEVNERVHRQAATEAADTVGPATGEEAGEEYSGQAAEDQQVLADMGKQLHLADQVCPTAAPTSCTNAASPRLR